MQIAPEQIINCASSDNYNEETIWVNIDAQEAINYITMTMHKKKPVPPTVQTPEDFDRFADLDIGD